MRGCNKRIVIKVSDIEFMFLVAYLIFFGALIIWSVTNWNRPLLEEYEIILFPWIISSLVINIFGFVFVKKIKYVDVGFWYVISSYIFMFGYVFIKYFRLDTTLVWDPSYAFTETSRYHASIYTLLCLCAVSLGCFVSRRTIKIKKNVTDFSALQKKIMLSAGWIFFTVGLVANIINAANLILVTRAAGTYVAYVNAASSGLIDDFAYLMIPGIIHIFCSRTLSKGASYLLLFSSVAYFAVIMILSGSRKTQIFAIISIVLCFVWVNSNVKLKTHRIVLLMICAILLLNLIYVIRDNRTNLVDIIPAYLESLSDFRFIGQIVGETFAEAGLTFYSVAAIVQYVPAAFPYELGMTIIRTIPSILPIGWLIGDFFNKAVSTFVINRYTGVPVGASLIGDFYWNFGLVGGVLSSILFGIILFKLPNKMLTNSKKEPMYFSLFFILLMGVRVGIFEMFRPLVMVVLVPALIKKIVLKKDSMK